jgi:hypothetical protein
MLLPGSPGRDDLRMSNLFVGAAARLVLHHAGSSILDLMRATSKDV